MIDQAVEDEVPETDDLDWKSELPSKGAAKKGRNEDWRREFAKDVAALANRGGGTIVYGVNEVGAKPVGRGDVELQEGLERDLRAAAVALIHPPVFGLGFHRLGSPPRRAVALVVPASVEVPHLVYYNEYFGAPVRNGADTAWLREGDLERMYRARLDDRRRAADAVHDLYHEVRRSRDTGSRAWFVAAARPRILSAPLTRPTHQAARAVLQRAAELAGGYVTCPVVHPLASVNQHSLRPGLRRWVAGSAETWPEAVTGVHHDGSVSIAAATGGAPCDGGRAPSHEVLATAVECAVADLMGLVRAAGQDRGLSEYDAVVGVEWSGPGPVAFRGLDPVGFPLPETSPTLFTPIATTVRVDVDDQQYREQVSWLALDCVNQGGVERLRCLPHPGPGPSPGQVSMGRGADA